MSLGGFPELTRLQLINRSATCQMLTDVVPPLIGPSLIPALPYLVLPV